MLLCKDNIDNKTYIPVCSTAGSASFGIGVPPPPVKNHKNKQTKSGHLRETRSPSSSSSPTQRE